MSTRQSFIAELQRRNVYRAAVFYAGAAWLPVQIARQDRNPDAKFIGLANSDLLL